MTDPAKPLGEELDVLLGRLRERTLIGSEDEEFLLSDAEARALLSSFLEAKAEEMAKVCDGIKAQYVQAHYDAHGHITEGPYSAGAWDAADKCAAALRAVGKGEKHGA